MSLAFGSPRGVRSGRLLRAALSGTASLALVGGVVLPSASTALAAPAPAQATEQDLPTALATPEDALAYLVFELDEESDQWTQSQALIERAGFGDALDRVRDETLRDAAGNDVPLDAILGGEGAVIITEEALQAIVEAGGDMGAGGGFAAATPAVSVADAEAFGAVFLLDARAPDTAFAAIQSGIEDQAQQNGGSVDEVDYQGVTIESVEGTADGENPPLAVARVDDLIAVAGAPADLEAVIDTAQGGPSLADFEPFANIRGELDEEALFFGFFNGVAAAEVQTDILGGLAGVEGLANLAGLNGPAGMGASGSYTGILVSADEPGFRLETASAPAEGDSFPPATATFDSELAARLPADTLFLLNGSDLGATGLLDRIGAGVIALALGGFSEGNAAATPIADLTTDEFIAQQYEQAAGLLGVNLQTDFFQQFVGEFGLAISSQADPSSITALFATELGDPGTVVNALQQISVLLQSVTGAQGEATTRQVDGSQVTVVDTGGAVPTVEYGVVGGQFLLGLGSAIDDYGDESIDALADDAQYQDVMAALPSEVNGRLYVDLAQIVPLLQGLAESDMAGGGSMIDADPSCQNYDTQAEAQEAYDAFDEDTFDLDQDFDGEACEDFFGSATPEAVASPVASPVADLDLSAFRAFGLVAYESNGFRRSSGILFIEDAG